MARKYPIYVPPIEIHENFKIILEKLRKSATLQEIREVAITLALELEPGAVADLLAQCVPPTSRKIVEEEMLRFKDPWWLVKARELYWYAKSQRPPKIDDISRARAILKRYGVPEPYHRLAMLIALGKCEIEF